MPTVSEAITIAVGHHQAGRLHEAEQIYRQVLSADPACVDAWNLLGIMATQTGQYQPAVELIGRALQLRPDCAEFHFNLGVAFQGDLKLDEAIAAYRRALAIDPNHANSLKNIGSALHDQGKLAEAIAFHRQARDLNPDVADTHFNLGNDFKAEENWDEAIICYQRALELNPNWGEVHNNLGDALQGRGDLQQAIASYRRALTLIPDSPQVHNNLGGAFQVLNDWDQATACYRRAVELSPDFPLARLNLGIALTQLASPDEAAQHVRHALRLNPDDPDVLNALGLVLRAQGRSDEALQSFERAVMLKPDFADAHTNHAMQLLARGDFERGWPEYEWRWQTNETAPRQFDRPLWDGRNLRGQTILLYAEQGLGDTLQFIRYAQVVQATGAKVIVECQKALQPLLASCPGIDRLIPRGDQLPTFDVQAPLLSVPALLKTTLETVPADIPYLRADPNLVAHWCQQLTGLKHFRVGINWRGRTGQGAFRQRDIPLECFASLSDLPITLVCLQRGSTNQELADITTRLPTFHPGDNFDQAHGAFMDSAAIMKNLDLVITSDTSVPHLAGALGVPVWIALPYVASWQWMRDRTDSPWYPTARLFRQRQPGDWNSVFDEIRSALQILISQ